MGSNIGISIFIDENTIRIMQKQQQHVQQLAK